MTISLGETSAAFARAARRRECDADEARWEAQLRKMAGRETREARPRVTACLAPTRTALPIATAVTRRDTLLIPRTLPSFTGQENEDLVCGKCADVIGFRISPRTTRRAHPEGDRLVLRCTCGALNLLSH